MWGGLVEWHQAVIRIPYVSKACRKSHSVSAIPVNKLDELRAKSHYLTQWMFIWQLAAYAGDSRAQKSWLLLLEMQSYTSQCEISLGNWCLCLSGFIDIINMVSRKVSLARAALSGKILQPSLLGSWSPFKYAIKTLLHCMGCQKEETKPCQSAPCSYKSEGKPQPMAGCLETHWRMLM